MAVGVTAVTLAIVLAGPAAGASGEGTVLAKRDTTKAYTFLSYYDTGGDFSDQVRGDPTPDDISFNKYGLRVVTPRSRHKVKAELSIECATADDRRRVERSYTMTRTTPFVFWRAATIPRAASCYVVASADRIQKGFAYTRARMIVTLLGSP